jgi:DNA topoisomerase IB
MSILGYSDQPASQLEQVNRNKISEEAQMRYLDALSKIGDADQRWLSIARTHFEQAFMALNRSIMKPKRLTDDELRQGMAKMIGDLTKA